MSNTVYSYIDNVLVQASHEESVSFWNETIPFEKYQYDRIENVKKLAEQKQNAGCPMQISPSVILHVDLSDGSRADMSGMSTTALASLSGAIPWPDSYKLGWITKENIRIPLATPAAGLGFAATVGNYYAQIAQRRRTLKDALQACTTKEQVDNIHIDVDWPDE